MEESRDVQAFSCVTGDNGTISWNGSWKKKSRSEWDLGEFIYWIFNMLFSFNL